MMMSDVPELHVCPECMAEDEEPYLHTVHQLPGVRMCPKHRIPLMRVKYRKAQDRSGNMNQKVLDETSMVQIPLRADPETENRISRFMADLHEHTPDTDLVELQAVILERMKKLGYPVEAPYGNLAQDLTVAGYGELFNEDVGKCIRKLLMRDTVVFEKAIALLTFLFPDYDDFHAALMSGNTNTEDFPNDLFPEYIIRKNSGWIAEVECKKCGQVFHIHPYALLIGCGCPSCSGDADATFAWQLTCLGDGKYKLEGEFPGYGLPVKIRHETCEKVRSVNSSDLIWMEKRCQCEKFLSKEQLQDRIDRGRKQFTIIEYRGGRGSGQFATIRHEGCGQEFTIGLQTFERNPYCRRCNSNRAHADEFNRQSETDADKFKKQSETDADKFNRQFKTILGDEYDLLTLFMAGSKPIRVRHRTCGTVTEGLPYKSVMKRQWRSCT